MKHLYFYENHKIDELNMFKSNSVKLNDIIKLYMDNGVILTVKKIADYVPDDKPVWEILDVKNENEEVAGYAKFGSLPDMIDILPIGDDCVLGVGTKMVVRQNYISIYGGRTPYYYCKISRIFLNDKEIKNLDITK